MKAGSVAIAGFPPKTPSISREIDLVKLSNGDVAVTVNGSELFIFRDGLDYVIARQRVARQHQLNFRALTGYACNLSGAPAQINEVS